MFCPDLPRCRCVWPKQLNLFRGRCLFRILSGMVPLRMSVAIPTVTACRISAVMLGGMLAVLLGGCTLAPEYTRPANHASSADYALAADQLVAGGNTRPAGQAVGHRPSRWWESYGDTLLNKWIAQLSADNLDLRAAAERIVQADEQVRIQRGAWWPAVGLTSNSARSFAPAPGGALGGSQQRAYTSSVDAGATVAWQIDLFGRVRNAVASAEYSALASATDHSALLQTLIVELVSRRVALALLLREIDIQQDIVQSREQTLNTVSRRYELGVKNASAVDVHTARENLTSARAQLVFLQQQMAATLLVVDVLLNQRPGALQGVDTLFPVLPPNDAPPVDTPLALLDQRPDIRGSELRLMAANAGIGIAVADLFPDLTISASRGFNNDQLGGLLTNNNAVGVIAGKISARLFEGGRLRAQIRLRESRMRELTADYARTVLVAMAEVETALIQERFLGEQIDNLQAGVVASRQAEVLAQERYQRGITPLLELLEAQRRRQNAERSLLAAQRASWSARINLHLALGGDWLVEERL